MTTLRKPIYRLSAAAFDVLRPRKFRQIVVGLEPGDVITFREKGRRHKWTFAIDKAFRAAVVRQAEKDRQAAREAKKNNGGR